MKHAKALTKCSVSGYWTGASAGRGVNVRCNC